jgi:hypothetical protein
MSWVGVRDGVKTRLDTISGLSARDTMPETLPDKDTATVLPGDGNFIEPSSHGTLWKARFVIMVRCVRSKLKDSQDALDVYINPTGASSVIAAVYGDRTLGGVVDDVKCLGVAGYRGVDNTVGVQADVQFEAYFNP